MGQTIIKKNKLYSQAGSDPYLGTRILTLENNVYKITYYEIISGASGSLTIPTGATINADEFGLSGNCILSEIDSFNKPTYKSPVTSSGVAVTASLNVSNKTWVKSGVTTSTYVALIYSFNILSLLLSNANVFYVIGPTSLITDTSSYALLAGANFTGPITATNLSGTNTGDETNATIKTKLGSATTASDGYLLSTDWNTFNNKQSNIPVGTTLQYWRGDKTFQNLDTSVTPDTLNRRYVTDANLVVINNTSGINTGDKFYTTNFFSAITVTALNTQHNLNRIPNIEIYDNTGQKIFANSSINFTNFDISITFNRLQSGTLILT